MTSSSVFLLVIHGSRDPRPQIAVERLAKLLHQRLEILSLSSHCSHSWKNDREMSSLAVIHKPCLRRVYTASLELASMPLHEKIQEIAQEVELAGIRQLKILPLFLLPGVHVKQDIPAEIVLAQRILGKDFHLKLQPYLGSSPQLIRLVAQQFKSLGQKNCIEEQPEEGRIIVAHGSRRLGGNQPIETLASCFNGTSAYWSVPPNLEEKVKEMVQAGKRQILIAPYFLFAGGITAAIAQQIEGLQYSFPQIQFRLGQPLGTLPQFTDLISEALK